jgi:hypothetical protein
MVSQGESWGWRTSCYILLNSRDWLLDEFEKSKHSSQHPDIPVKWTAP